MAIQKEIAGAAAQLSMRGGKNEKPRHLNAYFDNGRNHNNSRMHITLEPEPKSGYERHKPKFNRYPELRFHPIDAHGPEGGECDVDKL